MFRGIFNHYNPKLSFVDKLIKDVKHLSLVAKNSRKSRVENSHILVYPEYPSGRTTIFKIAKQLGCTLSNKPSTKQRVAIFWENETHRTKDACIAREKIRTTINVGSTDISKTFVDKVHQEVFGYSTRVDPLVFQGEMVQKSNGNAKHDGVVVTGPITEVKPDTIYQVIIDNTYDASLIQDIRVPFIGEVVDFVYLKYRPIAERFQNTTVKSEVKKTSEILSQEEIGLIATFCEKMNLDFGELDVLRHKPTGKIYVVDVNNTPYGPPAHLEKLESLRAIKRLASYFEKNFLNK